MDTRHPETMLQIIVGTRQACNVITLKEPCCEGVCDVAKMLKCLHKRSQRGEITPHLGKESQISFPDVLTRVLLWIGQDRFGLIQEAVGVLKRRPQRRCGLQPFGQELLHLL
jgi:hypothetical protein